MNVDRQRKMWGPVDDALEALRKAFPEAVNELDALADLLVGVSVEWEDQAHREAVDGLGIAGIAEGECISFVQDEAGVTLRGMAERAGLDARVYVGTAGISAPVVDATMEAGRVVLDLPTARAFGADGLHSGVPQRYRYGLIQAALDSLDGDLTEAGA